MKRFVLFGLALFVLVVAPTISSAACISTQAGDWDDCSERRGSREPASWCGGGTGSPSGWRQQREQDIEDAIAKLKVSFALLLVFSPSPEID